MRIHAAIMTPAVEVSTRARVDRPRRLAYNTA